MIEHGLAQRRHLLLVGGSGALPVPHAPLEVRAIIAGSGTVVRQSPAPGTPLPLERGLRLWCEEVVLRPTAVVPETARLAASSSSGTP